ncbi:GTPase IMAP family member 9-like [Anableps anableps]
MSKAKVQDTEDCDVTILLIGKTGTGKSSAGNIIVRQNYFVVGQNTLVCERRFCDFPDGRRVAVIDTPGLFHTNLTAEEMMRQLARCISLCAPGPHVFLIVIDPEHFSREEQEIVKIIKRIFGEWAARYTMVLFTHGDEMERRGGQIILPVNPPLNDFLSICPGGYHIFDNDENINQVNELVGRIDEMVQRNGGSCYTNDMFREAHRAIRQEMSEAGVNIATAERNNFTQAVDRAAAPGSAEVADVVTRVRALRENWCTII